MENAVAYFWICEIETLQSPLCSKCIITWGAPFSEGFISILLKGIERLYPEDFNALMIDSFAANLPAKCIYGFLNWLQYSCSLSV